MEIREFAERVLHSPSLEQKLEVPGRLTDTRPGEASTRVVRPARPPGLAFTAGDTPRATFPKATTLDDDLARGRALHFFANHELMALELMALALLRFPEAPPAFRKRMVATMRDEQRHMRLYLERMAELGVEIGEIPLNSFFWDLIAPMASPMDFVASMSLTFEQANLDFSLYYRDAFQVVGDLQTAAIMDRVLVDEVAHVRHGVRLFEDWRDPEVSQWEAYRRTLTFPLTPARAKGIGFTVQHRLDAGLDQDFIDRLRVYSHSKGRPPRVLMFNPDTETALGRQAKGHTPPAQVLTMARDLETLPMFVMATEDVLLVRREPRPAFLAELLSHGYGVPEFVTAELDTRRFSATAPLSTRRLAELAPWGWDPRSAEFLQPLAAQVTDPPADLAALVSTRAHLGSKAWLAQRVSALLGALPEERRALCVTDSLPTVADDMVGVEADLAEHRARGYATIVAKAPFGTAGRGALRIASEGPTDRQRRWLEDTLTTQGSVVLEPWYARLLDFSYLFKLHPDGEMTEVGFNPFYTDATGRYRGAILGNIKLALGEEMSAFVHRGTSDAQWMWRTIRQVARGLGPDLNDAGFSGLAGLDLMIVRDQAGELKLRVPLEL
ncbi:MAG: DUF455 family protein, partial [Myxococcota bacterium]|nr:DUF455 family protein [Myxococcota bacterium]